MIAVAFVIGAVYFWAHRRDYGFMRGILPNTTNRNVSATQIAELDWRPVDESAMGFKLEMPGDPKQVVVQAANESGSTEPVSMLVVKPDAETTYAVAWQDKPAVARMNDLVPDKTLDQARDGSMARTETILVSESRNTLQGFPGRDIVSRNAGGGILDTRFVFAGSRLYMLIATSPSAAARRQGEIMRFFESFAIAGNAQIPETLPSSTQ
jgi:hypothetical protein